MNHHRGRRQHAPPLFINRLDATGTARALDRITLNRTTDGEAGDSYDEGWLQTLIHRFPQTLPIGEIEPGLAGAVPVCMELPTEVGFVDNLFVTSQGDLVLTECKLWRNPEARREVVAQIIDYAHCMARWRYEDLERAIAAGTTPERGPPAGPLYEMVGGEQSADEAAFVDAVSRNLRLGRLLLLVVGDGIREGVESLRDHLQRHAGFHFTLGIVECAIHRLPGAGGFVIHPRVLARTVNIERGIVRLEEGKPVVLAPPSVLAESAGGRRPSISEEHFFESMGALAPALPGKLQSFLRRAAAEGVFFEFAQSLLLKWRDSRGNKFNLGCIYPNGDVRMDPVNWVADSIGRLDLAHDYQGRVAAAIGGSLHRAGKPTSWYAAVAGKQPRIDRLLDEADRWLDAIRHYTSLLEAAGGAAEGELERR